MRTLLNPEIDAGYTPMATNGTNITVCAACGPGKYKSTPGRFPRGVHALARNAILSASTNVSTCHYTCVAQHALH